MAKIRYGFGVSSVSGKLSNVIHTGSRYGPIVKHHVYSNPKPSPLQIEQRNIFNRCVQAWRSLEIAERAVWELYSEFYNSFSSSGSKSKLDGYHVFCELNGNLLQIGDDMITAPVWSSVIFAPIYGTLYIGTANMHLQIINIPLIADEVPVIRCTPPLPPSVMTDQNKLTFIQWDGYDEDVMHFDAGYAARFGSMPAVDTRVFVNFYFINTTTGFKSGVYYNSQIVT